MAVNEKIPSDTKRGVGRPRLFDADAALDAALLAFWTKGYVSTSLDDLTRAMRVGRPSLYAAFGDKRRLFLAVLNRYAERARAALAPTLMARGDLEGALTGFFRAAIDFYTAGPEPLGCLISSVAALEAKSEPFIGEALAAHSAWTRDLFERRFQSARDADEIARDADLAAMAFVAALLLQGIGAQARVGQPVADLKRLAAAAAAAVIAAGGSGRK